MSRNLIRRHPRLWETMRDPTLARGGRLVQLGTPNYGSFSIPQVMTGTDKMIDLLATLDVKHNLAELLEITNTFIGTYQLLPAPEQAIHHAPDPISQRDLGTGSSARIAATSGPGVPFLHDLEDDGETIDPARMLYIAGCKRATLSGLTISVLGSSTTAARSTAMVGCRMPRAAAGSADLLRRRSPRRSRPQRDGARGGRRAARARCRRAPSACRPCGRPALPRRCATTARVADRKLIEDLQQLARSRG